MISDALGLASLVNSIFLR